MARFAPLVIHRSEWERIKNQANPESETKMPCKVDIEAMNTQSRKWTATWPDSCQGKVNRVTMRNKKARLEELVKLETFYKNQKRDNTTENLKRARAMIFDRTGYGRELLSALIESKTLEERDKQIQFKRYIQEQEKNIEEAKLKIDNLMYAEFEKRENDTINRKIKEREDAECNRIISELKKEEAFREAEMDKKNRLEDAILMEKFHQLQIAEENHDPCLDKEAVKIYEEQNKAIKEMRAKREALDQVLADLWGTHQDRVRKREKQVFDQMHKEKNDTELFRHNYDLVQRLQAEEKKKYNDFVDKGVRKLEKRLQKKEQEEQLKKEQQRITKTDQTLCKQPANQQECEKYQRKCCVDKQSFLPDKRGLRASKLGSLQESRRAPSAPRPQFLLPSTSIQDALKQRAAQPGGWSGVEAAHAQFAKHAAATLKEAAYKRPVQKVIDSYCKMNNVKVFEF